MSRHEGVSCDSCLKSNFKGKRYKCLICYDYDLCATCYEAGATTTRHTTDHPVQCIITRSDFDIFYGGEALTAEQPQAFSCPYCSKMGFTEATLQEHVTAEHADTSVEVVCPICASLPGGDPNHVTDDFAAHLTLEHRAPREFMQEEPTGIHRHVRRIPHTGRGVGSTRTRRGTNMHFSSGGTTLTGMSPSGREAMDPIAELLSQLSSVRNRAAAAQSVTSQLQQLEMQLQTTRQHLERTPRRQAEAAKATTAAGVTASTEGQGAIGAGNNNNSSSNSLYLLSRCADSVIDESPSELQQERWNRSLFVQELLLSTLTEQLQINDNSYTLENMDLLTEKLVSPSISEVSKVEKGKSDSSGPSETDGAGAREGSGVASKNSTETVSQINGGATGVTVKSVGAKTVDKCGTKQKATSSVTPQSSKGATGSLPLRGVRQGTIHHQNQGERERHSQALHNIRQGTVNAVDLSNNLSLNVARGGNSGYDSAENPQPLPGRPGSAGRDREGRMNPPTAKRNMVKHLPATKASDREPPPH